MQGNIASSRNSFSIPENWVMKVLNKPGSVTKYIVAMLPTILDLNLKYSVSKYILINNLL